MPLNVFFKNVLFVIICIVEQRTIKYFEAYALNSSLIQTYFGVYKMVCLQDVWMGL